MVCDVSVYEWLVACKSVWFVACQCLSGWWLVKVYGLWRFSVSEWLVACEGVWFVACQCMSGWWLVKKVCALWRVSV